jgi:hypothetical protein
MEFQIEMGRASPCPIVRSTMTGIAPLAIRAGQALPLLELPALSLHRIGVPRWSDRGRRLVRIY